jgi:two-component system response regulator HydG
MASSNVLITGESGTGKELIAKAIHSESMRQDKPFVAINCAAIPTELMEAELFGQEKGAFTGAHKQTMGKFEFADQGTIFLDEISSLKPEFQAKLLRVIQEREFSRVGSHRNIEVDIRIIAATNVRLEEMVKENTFREDLYFRLNVVPISLPPLRKRKGDIPLLADFFLKRFAEKNKRVIKGFTPRAVDLLMRYDWSGNVRELENVVERAVIMARGEMITPMEFPENLKKLDLELKEPSLPLSAGRSLKEVEKEMILRTLAETGGNRTHAANILGISRRTLQLKLKEYGINPP